MRVSSWRQFGRLGLNPAWHARRAAAFTLVELLFVLAVLVVAASVVMPALSRWQRGMPLDQARQLVKYELARTSVLAMSEASAWTVTYDLGGRRFRRFPSFLTDVRLQEEFELPAGVRFEKSGRSSGSHETGVLRFFADGTATQTTLVLTDSTGVSQELKLDRLTGTMQSAMDP
ncbi:MAG: hypothetical protein ABGZ17_13955 [Planctomycetaceae bacterium]